MDFGNLREKSVKIGKYWKYSKSFGSHPENAGCIQLIIMEFSGVHTDIARSVLEVHLTPVYLKSVLEGSISVPSFITRFYS